MIPKKQVISIIGTTGVGKSQLSIELATRFNGEIINADSMQMYKKLDIITNKHPIEERNGVPHHVMNHVEWEDEYDMHRFKRDLLQLIEDIHSRGKLPIIVGGTHYYLQSLLFTNKMVVTNDTEMMKEEDMYKGLSLEQVLVLQGPEENLIVELQKIDPYMGNKFHPNDHRRIKRSLEIFYKTGKRASDIYKSQKEVDETLRFKTLFLWVWSEQQVLNDRLDSRVDTMLQKGGMHEIQELYDYNKVKPDCERGVWQVIGFKEFLPWFTKRETLQTCIEDMKTRTRRYSKRQVKWIKSCLCEEEIFLLDATDLSKWDHNVDRRGISITEDFLLQRTISEPRTPVGLEKMMMSVHKKEEAPTQYQCDICKDVDGNALVILSGQWELHLKGSKHKSCIKKRKRKREYEEWLNQKKTPS